MICTRCPNDRPPANLTIVEGYQPAGGPTCPECLYAAAVKQYQAQQLAPHRPERPRLELVVVDVPRHTMPAAARRRRAS